MIDPADSFEMMESMGEPSIEEGARIDINEVQADTAETRENLRVLPGKIESLLSKLAPGAGTEVYQRALVFEKECNQRLDSIVGPTDADIKDYGVDDDNTAESARFDKMSTEDIKEMSKDLLKLCDELLQQVSGENSDTKDLDISAGNAQNSRSESEFWLLLTGNAQFGPGQEVTIGEYTIRAKQSQGREGLGGQDREVVIEKTEDVEEEDEAQVEVEKAGSVVAAEESGQEVASVTQLRSDSANTDPIFKRHKSDERYPNEIEELDEAA